MTVRDQIFRDIDTVFLNPEEFATSHTISVAFDGNNPILLVTDDDRLVDRTDASTAGTHLGEVLIFVKASDLKGKPAPKSRVTVEGGRNWYVRNVVDNFGMYEIRLGADQT
jgi:hypothetical protein